MADYGDGFGERERCPVCKWATCSTDDHQRIQQIQQRLDAAPPEQWEVVGNTVGFAKGWHIAMPGAIPLASFIGHAKGGIEWLLAQLKATLDADTARTQQQPAPERPTSGSAAGAECAARRGEADDGDD